jgi:hypothetical protein
MTTEELKALFEKHNDQFLKNPEGLMGRRDLAAFNLLSQLVPGSKDIVACAEHDQIWLDVSLEELAASPLLLEKDVVELIRCGVRIDEDTDSLSMFC